MIALWRRMAARIDDLPLRERTLVFAGAASVLVLLAYVLALQPLLRQQRSHLERVRLDQAQLKSIEDEVSKSAATSKQDVRAAKRERVANLEASVAAAERQLAKRRDAEQLSPAQLARMLQDMLGKNSNLRIAALRVLPATPVAQSQPGSKTPPAQFYRHSMEIEMTGTYLELLRYLENVEALPWRLAWSNVELRTTTYPQVQLRGTLYVLSSSPTLISF